uniref:cupin domain-containing protein n=1 Tax=Halomonas salipaludis TaxID=2032625 RepID=UPI00159522C6|nr:cupin domain-containing protein [Halomonas salipaludis]
MRVRRCLKVQTSTINLAEKFGKFTEHWSPRVVAEMNDYQFKVVKFKGDFVWHDHKDTDEVFLVVKGSMGIELRDGMVHLSEGEMYVVPKGVEHKPFAESECHVLLIEPRGIVNTGDEGGELKAENDIWI